MFRASLLSAILVVLVPGMCTLPPLLGLRHQDHCGARRASFFLLLASGCEDKCEAIRRIRRKALRVLEAGSGAGAFASIQPAVVEATELTRTRLAQTVKDVAWNLGVGLGTCCPCELRDINNDWEETSMEADSECDVTYQQVKDGLAAGYRFFDTASHYSNERSVGRAVADAVRAGFVAREDVLVCTKVWFDDLGYEKTLEAVAESNAKISLGQDADFGADIVLIHFPGGIDAVQSPARNRKNRKESWQALEKLKSDGKVRFIGVSNYARRHMKELLSYATTKPDVVEMEVHPFNQQQELRDLCKENNIQVIGFSPLAHGDLPVLENNILKDIAEAYEKTVPQVVLRWMQQEGIMPVVFTTKQERLSENLKIDDFRLAELDMDKIRSLDAGRRVGFDPNLIA